MPVPIWQATITDRLGNVLPFASIEVRSESVGSPLATLFSDRDGLVPLGNPFQADNTGYARFFVTPGLYQITATANGEGRQWKYVVIEIGFTDPAGSFNASETQRGIIELANNAEAIAGTDDLRAITPLKTFAAIAAKVATETASGSVELATSAEVITGTDAVRAVTPAGLQAKVASDTVLGIVELATSAEAITGTDTLRAVTPAANIEAIKARSTLLAKKVVDESRISTIVLANDSVLFFPMLANRVYAFTLNAYVSSNGATDFKFRHTGPAAPINVAITRRTTDTVSTITALDAAYSAADVVLATNSTPPSASLTLTGMIQNGANAGNFNFQWAQAITGATATIVLAGSTITWSEL